MHQVNNNNFEIASDWKICQSTINKLIQFLTNIKHLESILPKDKIHNFQVLENNKISFEIEQIIQLTLSIDYDENNTVEPHRIYYHSEPFGNYHLSLIAQFQNNQSQIILTGNLNPFVLSIARKKLQHLVDRINQELSNLILS
ncbi:MAG: hypothetical protein KatS3mg027_1158 [Bacteroidia bacterium]|nr:MAG: hypothetical protein KatS3mg027_1158 [Bacteroidia bacterium]